MKAPVIDRLTDEDTQILKLGRGMIRGHTCKLVLVEPGPAEAPLGVEALRDHVGSRLDQAPRLRKRVLATPLHLANPVWVDDPDFDIAHHISRVPVEAPLSWNELVRVVARLMAEPLDLARPLWQMSVVDQLVDGGAAIVWRVHHSLADGTTCVRLASALLWDHEPTDDPAPRTLWRPAPAPSRWSLLASGLAERTVRWRPRKSQTAPRKSIAATEAIAARELGPAAGRTRLGARIGPRRSVAFASVPLQPIRAAGKSIADSVTVNDAVLAIVAGAVRGWLRPSTSIRVKVPVSLHGQDETAEVSNHNSFFFVDLPVDEPDPRRRVLAISRETRERKLDHDAETLYHLGTHPLIAHWSMSPHVFTFNVSNVPGPKEHVSLLGSRVTAQYSLAEVAQHHALRVAVMSAAGSLCFGLCADRDAVPDLDLLAEGIHAAADELLQAASSTPA